ncbi:MAG: hypothetical protein QOD80_2035, partial [Verrucomicrobiota bacterium]
RLARNSDNGKQTIRAIAGAARISPRRDRGIRPAKRNAFSGAVAPGDECPLHLFFKRTSGGRASTSRRGRAGERGASESAAVAFARSSSDRRAAAGRHPPSLTRFEPRYGRLSLGQRPARNSRHHWAGGDLRLHDDPSSIGQRRELIRLRAAPRLGLADWCSPARQAIV